jgi:uncharacterized coiled-coil protein SlyX
MKNTWIGFSVGLLVASTCGVLPVFAEGKKTVQVSVGELRKINERLQRLEDDVKAKDERIRSLEGRLGEQKSVASPPASPTGEVAKTVEQHETRLNSLTEALHAPFGGEFSLMPGGQSGPFRTGSDFFIAGALDLPLWRKDPLFGQKLLGEIMIGYGRSTDDGVFVSPLTLMAPAMGLPSGAYPR